MAIKKKIRKGIILSLTGIILSTSIFGQASAMQYSQNINDKVLDKSDIIDSFDMTEKEFIQAQENRERFTYETDESELFSNEQVSLTKIEFQQKYGTEDKFVFVEEFENIKSEVNGARGIIRITDLETGEVDNIEYFKNLDKLNDKYETEYEDISYTKATPSRPGAWRTQGPDKANLSVKKGSTRDTIKASNPVTGKVKTYTKNTGNWYSGYTKGYYDNVSKARKSIGTAKSYAGSAGQNALLAVASDYILEQNFFPGESKFLVAYRTAVAGATVTNAIDAARYGVAYLANISVVFNNYRKL